MLLLLFQLGAPSGADSDTWEHAIREENPLVPPSSQLASDGSGSTLTTSLIPPATRVQQ